MVPGHANGRLLEGYYGQLCVGVALFRLPAQRCSAFLPRIVMNGRQARPHSRYTTPFSFPLCRHSTG